MKCSRCQHENEAGAKFCEECAAPLARACAKCGRPLTPTAKFCSECAHPTGLPASPPPGHQFDSPESYTPKHLAEKILTTKGALEGERKHVTVLFADLKGSMELLADRDPEEARKLLDPVLERMMEAVHRYEGIVNQVMGDGIMALFGAPVAHEDHAVRACYAALRMQESVKRYAEDVRRREGVVVQIRVGLNPGEVVVRSIGSDLRMDYTAVGQTTHLAARMEQSAAPGTTLVTAETLRLAEGYIQVVPLGPIPVKGLGEPVQAYELTGAVAGRSRFQTLAARGLTKFVGRASEIEQLSTALSQARAGHGQVGAVVGEPGVGKSRLFWEFTHSHRTEGCLIVEAGSVSYGKATSYLPVIELLRAYFQLEARDDERKVREKVTGKLLSLDRTLESSLPALLALLDVQVDEEGWTRLDPSQRRQRTLDGVKRLLLREAQVQPVIVVFEDLHWIDGETQALLDGLVESLPMAKMLLLVNYRPEYAHPWSGKTYYRLLRIDALPVESAEELLEALLGAGEELSPLKRLLIQRTEGNPFFLEESVRALVESGALSGERGSYLMAKPLQTLHVPMTAQAILAARIDRLSPEDKRLLQTASVVGKDVPYNLLHAVIDEGEDALRLGLARLQVAEFLYETQLFPELEYTFKHALTHEVVYGSLLHDRRRDLHARIADAIETTCAGRIVEQVERLANHAVRGHAWAKALQYLDQAAAKARNRSAHREAVAFLDEARSVLPRLPEDRQTIERAINLCLDLRASLVMLGELDRVREVLDEAEAVARSVGDDQRLGYVLTYQGHYYYLVGEHDRAIEAHKSALTLARASGDSALEVATRARLGATLTVRGHLRQARPILAETVAHLGSDDPPLRGYLRQAGLTLAETVAHLGSDDPPLGHSILMPTLARVFLVLCLTELGEFRDAIAVGEEAMQRAEAAQHPDSVIHAGVFLGEAHLQKGNIQEAARALERAFSLCKDESHQLLYPRVASALACAYALAGASREVLDLCAQASARNVQRPRARVMIRLAEVYLLVGRADEAIVGGRQGLDVARQHKERGSEAWALRVLGDACARRDQPDADQAEGYYREAITVGTEVGLRPLVAHCHAGLAKLYGRIGKRIESDEQFAIAASMYHEMDMGFWLKKAEAAAEGGG